MKISLNLIRDYTEIKLTDEELVSKVRSQIGEVESVEKLSEKYEDIVLGAILSVESHPEAEKLNVYTVEIGAESPVQVVAGDKTLKAGDSVAYFKPGAKVPYNAYPERFDGVVKAVKLRGVLSEGMLASGKELDLNSNHEFVMRIESNSPVGTPIAEILGMNDTVIDIENKALTNRADCFGLIGIAREIAGIQGIKFNSPDWTNATLDSLTIKNPQLPIKVDVECPELCPRYIGITIADVDIKESPLWLQSVLVKSGMRPINNIVDITNYLMLLTGQPLHAFDYDKVISKDTRKDNDAHILVRTANSGETITTLDGNTHELLDTNLVITDGTNPIAIGGVIGGADTEIDQNTKNIILECATFDLYNIRRTSMQLGTFTDAVTRYSKGQDPNQCEYVSIKAVELIIELTKGNLSHIVDVFENKNLFIEKTIFVEHARLNEHLGLNISAEIVVSILKNVELKSSIENNGQIKVTVPTYRGDLNLPVDIHEEVGRLLGYNSIPITLPNRSIAPAQRNQLLDLKNNVREIFSSSGVNELLTYNFLNGSVLAKHNMPIDKAYRLTNPVSPELEYMRINLIPSLLPKLRKNLDAGVNELALYEVNKAHNRAILGEDSLPHEIEILALAISKVDKGHESSVYYDVKHYADLLFKRLGMAEIEYILISNKDSVEIPNWIEDTLTLYDSNASALIGYSSDAGRGIIGVLGELAPGSKKAERLPESTGIMELDLEAILEFKSDRHNYSEPSIYPVVKQDLCFVLDTSTGYIALLDALRLALMKNRELLINITPIDIYQSDKQVTEGKKQTTVRVELQHMEKTLKNNEVDRILADAVKTVSRLVGAQLLG